MDNLDQNPPVFARIQFLLSNHDVVLFMKGTPEMPSCGFSSFVSQVLKRLKIDFIGINVLEDNDMRQGIKNYTDWPTIPQLYIKGEFIGGADIIRDLLQSKEIYNVLKQHNIAHQTSSSIE